MGNKAISIFHAFTCTIVVLADIGELIGLVRHGIIELSLT